MFVPVNAHSPTPERFCTYAPIRYGLLWGHMQERRSGEALMGDSGRGGKGPLFAILHRSGKYKLLFLF